MTASELTSRIKDESLRIGFDLTGISPVGPFPEAQLYKTWLSRGHAGQMGYMERSPETRADVKEIMPEARSVITCGLNYNTPFPYSTKVKEKSSGWIARYAWGDDYHDIIQDKLRKLSEFIEGQTGGSARTRSYVDTGPVLERALAKYGGIGWIGKNTCLINQQIGSWLFLCEIITDLELEYDVEAPDRCGTCSKCIDTCPTDALIRPYELDSRLCISYLTIELKNSIPFELRESIDNNIFGCDICQDVCPWNNRADVSRSEGFQPRDGLFKPDLSQMALDADSFRRVFRGSPVKRTKRRGFLRNVLIAMGNSGDEGFLAIIKQCLADREPLVRAHAAWALWKIKGAEASEALRELLLCESDETVIEELENILSIIER